MTSKPSTTNSPNLSFMPAHSFSCWPPDLFRSAYLQLLLVKIGHLYGRMRKKESVDGTKDIQVVTAAGSHLFPFRTEKLSPLAPMVLQCNAGE